MTAFFSLLYDIGLCSEPGETIGDTDIMRVLVSCLAQPQETIKK